MKAKHPWQARLGVGIAMLLFAFIGMIVTDTVAGGGFQYWKWIVPVYAILTLWLSWYTHREEPSQRLVTLGHEIVHWIGLFLAVMLISWFVHLGNLSRFNAGLVNLTLLALSVFLAGVYTDKIFLFIGFILGILAMLSAYVVQYLWAIILPVVIGAALIIALIIWIAHKKTAE